MTPCEDGGRVLVVSGGRATIADAHGTRDVSVGELLPVEGDLVAVADGCIVSIARPEAFGRAGGDPARILLGGVGARLVARGRALAAIRTWAAENDFVEVETPLAVPSPGLDVHLAAVSCDGGFLITSPEYQMKRLVVGGLPRVLQLARCFRRDEAGVRHNPEFTMLEWYRAFAGYERVMADTEQIVRAVALALRGSPRLSIDGRDLDVSGPFARITVADAFERYAGVAPDETLRLAADDEDTFYRLMVDAVEPALSRENAPVFLVDYPAPQASLARKKPEDPRWAERFELYAGGVELCNGFGELTDPVEQRARLHADQAERERRGLPVYPIDERFLAALSEGMPPCAGNALGVDRLVMLATGARSLGDVQAFPAGEL